MSKLDKFIKELEENGCIVKEDKVLCATSAYYTNLVVGQKTYSNVKGANDKIEDYVWSIPTRSEIPVLKRLVIAHDDPKPSIKFAYIALDTIYKKSRIETDKEDAIEDANIDDILAERKDFEALNDAKKDENQDPSGDEDHGDDDAFGENDDLNSGDDSGDYTDLERKNLEEKDIDELREICKELDLDFASNSNKKTLINKILK